MDRKFLYVPFFVLLLFSCSENSEEHYVASSLPDKVDFNFHIKPILSDRCFKCHGPDEKVREANLRLDVKEHAFSLMDSATGRYAIVPGKLGESSLYTRISSKNAELMMPPPESNLSLSEREIQLMKRWIEQGAEWKEHWAFIPPANQELPKIKNKTWPKNEIDHFVLAKIEDLGLKPSPESEKAKLLRRLSFDLRGIAPNLEELDAFVADESPDAYEKWVDKFLASKSFGERLAMDWLDVARYADSHGYQDDIERSMWPWRDWVIKAFNENKPYDEFVSWQLAGDLLPNASYEQKLATGFNRNHKITQEVGVVDEEYRVEYVLDRVNTVSTSFLGLTVACAQCHDHKFDPISQKEFYSLFSFFNNVPEKGRVDYNVEVAEPSLPLPEETINKYTAYIKGLIQKQEIEISNYVQEKEAKQGQHAPKVVAQKTSGNIPRGLNAWYTLDFLEDSALFEEKSKRKLGLGGNGPVPIRGKFSGGLEFSSKNYVELANSSEIDFRNAFSFSFWIKSIDGGISGPILAPIYSEKAKGSRLKFDISGEKAFRVEVRNKATKQNLSLRSRKEIPPDKWVHMTIVSDGSLRAKGVHLYMDGEELELIVASDKMRSPLSRHKSLRIARYEKGRGLVAGQLDELMFFNKSLSEEEVQQLYAFNPIARIASEKESSPYKNKRLFYHQLHHEDTKYQSLTSRLREYKIREVRMADVILKPTMVMEDTDTLRPTFVLNRGAYDAPTERVYAGTPTQILPFPEEYPKNRLGFAKWLFSDKNPLTARVAVNRYWQMIFGQGIVTTPEDFGSQGDLPSHPELLDALAIDFINSGWDIKALLKKMLLSATYRQSIRSNEKLQEVDPNNVYLARGPSSRLSAEMLRDHALVVSGLLSEKVGGPSVKPYHPEGLWLEIASGNQPLRKYIQDHEEDLYRRSMYTFWKRTVPPPSMITFDAPSREECIVRRQATSTPMQALVLLNDPQFTEASRLIAERMLREGGNEISEQIAFAFRLATSRAPSSEEIRLLEELLEKQKADFEQEPLKAEQYLKIGEYPRTKEFVATELAAYTLLANAILNLTESIQKG